MPLTSDSIDRCACAAWGLASLAASMWVYGEVLVFQPEANWDTARHALCMAVRWTTAC